MPFSIVITCCCCKTKVHLSDNSLKASVKLVGWVSIGRRPFCQNCVDEFTEEDWDWLLQKPVPLGMTEVVRLVSEDVEPL